MELVTSVKLNWSLGPSHFQNAFDKSEREIENLNEDVQTTQRGIDHATPSTHRSSHSSGADRLTRQRSWHWIRQMKRDEQGDKVSISKIRWIGQQCDIRFHTDTLETKEKQLKKSISMLLIFWFVRLFVSQRLGTYKHVVNLRESITANESNNIALKPETQRDLLRNKRWDII
jgi:hypothetical protein